MSTVTFMQNSPRGGAEIDCSRLLVATDGSLFLRSVDGPPVPMSVEQINAVRDYFGTSVDLALKAVRSLA